MRGADAGVRGVWDSRNGTEKRKKQLSVLPTQEGLLALGFVGLQACSALGFVLGHTQPSPWKPRAPADRLCLPPGFFCRKVCLVTSSLQCTAGDRPRWSPDEAPNTHSGPFWNCYWASPSVLSPVLSDLSFSDSA